MNVMLMARNTDENDQGTLFTELQDYSAFLIFRSSTMATFAAIKRPQLYTIHCQHRQKTL